MSQKTVGMHVAEGIQLLHYRTHILRNIRADNLDNFGSGRFVYVTRYATRYVKSARLIDDHVNEAIEKKRNLFRSLPSPTFILSLVRSRRGRWRFHRALDENDDLLHVSCFSGRGSDLLNGLMLCFHLYRQRNRYDNVLFYNSYSYTLIAALVSKFVLRKRIYLDMEDDYNERQANWGSKVAFWILRAEYDGAILVNTHMQRYFRSDQKTAVVNAFADMSYLCQELSNTCGETPERPLLLLYSGTLDRIRGADLLPLLEEKLSSSGIDHQMYITGTGPLESELRAWSEGQEKVRFEGFVTEDRLAELLRLCHVGLVLQKPDHPFSKGSYPSKIGTYAKFRLQILVLKVAVENA